MSREKPHSAPGNAPWDSTQEFTRWKMGESSQGDNREVPRVPPRGDYGVTGGRGPDVVALVLKRLPLGRIM
jgi:hypothetical protein